MAAETQLAHSQPAAGVTAPQERRDGDRLLRIYLADHRAGAEAGRARSQRFAAANASNFLTEPARDVCRQIEEDVGTLDEILDRVGCRASRWKLAVARTLELLGRLKPNGRLHSYSPLSRLIELELLIAGIQTKESLWQTLARVQQQRSELAGFDFDDLQRRALQQRLQLESRRAQTVTEAFPS
jgi:hypothetical protein